MKNKDLYISPYGQKKKQGNNQFTSFLFSLIFGAMIMTLLLCILTLYL